MNLDRWNQNNPISTPAVQKLYLPEAHYTVRTANFPRHAKFEGSFLTGADVFVLSGQIRYKQGAESATLNAGDILKLTKGPYEAEVVGADTANVIMVHQLPEALWPK